MLGMSISDLIGSFAQFLSTWPIPAGVVVDGGPDIGSCYYGNAGNLTTCELQGFLIYSFAMAVPIYNSMLCLYFMLFIRYNWTEKRLRGIEPFMHGIALYPMATAIMCWRLGLFNPTGTFCWIAAYPLGCLDDDDVTCLRGESTFLFRILTTAVPVVLSFVTIIVTMSSLCIFVFKQETRITSLRAEDRGNYEQTKTVFVQACRYAGAYLFVWVPPIAYTVAASRYQYQEFEFAFIAFLVFPLQGVFNAIIYSKGSFSYWWCQRLISRMFNGGDGSSDEESSLDSSFYDVSTTFVGETILVSAANVQDFDEESSSSSS